MIIPEGIRALYSDVIEKVHNHKVIDKMAVGTATPESHEDVDVEHSSTIGLSLVLGKCQFFLYLSYFLLWFNCRAAATHHSIHILRNRMCR